MHKLILILIATVLCGIQAQTFQFPTDMELRDPTRWRINTSGKMAISYDKTEEALRFDIEYGPEVKDFWSYPIFLFKRGEGINGATAILFDMKVEAPNGSKGYKTANVILTGHADGGYFKYEVPQQGWQTVKVAFQDSDKYARNGVLSMQLGLNPIHDKESVFLKNFRFEGKPIEKVYPPRLSGEAPSNVWFHGKDIEITSNAKLKNASYVIQDWRGNQILAGQWADIGQAPLILKDFNIGYYRLSLTHDGEEKVRDYTFTVIVPPEKRKIDHASFFGMDSAQSWCAQPGVFDCPWYDGDSFRLVSDLLLWAGLPHIRERLSWTGTQRQDGSISYGYYMTNANYLKERGLLISGMFHDAPEWADKIVKIPRNLKALYDYTKNTGQAFGDRMGNWEFWNEQDIGFAPDPVWDYVAAMKAAYLGFKAANPKMIVAPGSICIQKRNVYDDVMYQNDAAKYCDIMNFHTYAYIDQYPTIFAELRDFQQRQGIGDRVVWVTESGVTCEGEGTADSVRKGLKAHSPEQELEQAEFYVKSQIALMNEGVERNYYFVFPPYNERQGRKDWGIMRRDGTVKPTFAAISNMTFHLMTAKLLGKVDLGDDQVNAYLFRQPDNSQTLVVWIHSRVDNRNIPPEELGEKTLSIPLVDGTYDTTDMVGTPSKIQAVNGKATVKASRYPIYILNVSGLVASIPPAATVGSVTPYEPKADEDMTIIYRIDLDKDDFTIGNHKTLAQLNSVTGKAKISIWNLDHSTKTGSVTATGVNVDGLPKEIQFPAMGKVEFDVVISSSSPKGTYNAVLELNGKVNAKKTSKLVMPILFNGLFLQECEKIKLNATSPQAWRKNDSADRTKISFDEKEQAVRFDLEWDKDETDRWFYPEYILELPQEEFNDAKSLLFDVKTDQEKVENDFVCCLVMFVYGTTRETGIDMRMGFPDPIRQWETRQVNLNDPKLKKDDVKMIRIGCNPKGKKMTFWIKNITLLK